MKYIQPLSRGVFIALISFMTLFPSATSQAQRAPSTNLPGMDMSSQLAGLTGAAFEVGFMSMMVAHHRGAVEMSRWILARTRNPDLRAAAKVIIAAQAPEITEMTGWLKAWYGRGVDEATAQPMQQEMKAMLGVMAKGDADSAFLSEMTAHHESALDMAQLALTRATHGKLRALARDIIVAQAKEIYAFQTRLAAGAADAK